MADLDLLYLRLQALALDIEKVDGAVKRAQARGRFLNGAQQDIEPCSGHMQAIQAWTKSLVRCLDNVPDIEKELHHAHFGLPDDLRKIPALIDEIIDHVTATKREVDLALDTTVSLSEQSGALEYSLHRRCRRVSTGIGDLLDKIGKATAGERGELWRKYQALLDDEARPVFTEYVDFLGGLAVRDAGLDDRVCGMTAELLTRFTSVTHPLPLPLPARQAALALDSVVLLGFPEWSIWGIPLVGHEVGLAYAKIRKDEDFDILIKKYLPEVPCAGQGGDDLRRAKEHLHLLLADVFATYTLGPAYACAAMLLRLSPQAGQPAEPGKPGDIERARAITGTLSKKGGNAPGGGADFTDHVTVLTAKWNDAVLEFTTPGSQPAAGQDDWLGRFIDDTIEDLRGQYLVPAYDQERWRASDYWVDFLNDALAGKKPRPVWGPNSVPDVLTAAWRLRLGGTDPMKLADCVTGLWPGDRGGEHRP